MAVILHLNNNDKKVKVKKILFFLVAPLLLGGVKTVRAQNSYTEGEDCKIPIVAGYVKIGDSDYGYVRILEDTKTGLVFYFSSLSSDAGEYGYCAVGMSDAYKTGDKAKEAVEIPAVINVKYKGDVNNGENEWYARTKKVKYIVDYAFTTTANGTIPDVIYTYPDGSTKNIVAYEGRRDYYNESLKQVTFADNSNVEQIGMGAFQGCVNLQEISIPSSVTSMFREAFTYCRNLKKVEFQLNDVAENGVGVRKTGLTILPYNCFYQCNSLESLELPEGITKIDSYALQDNWNLKQISLPNTLETIGAHFLCRALSLKSFYVPANVTSIDGAFLHGCESLRDVYLLGDASALKKVDAKDESVTFGNEGVVTAPTVNGVNNCTFHVLQKYADNYINDDVWKAVYGGANGVFGKDGNKQAKPTVSVAGDYWGYNRIVWGNEEYGKTFGPNKWQSVIFYESLTMPEFKQLFGDEALAATFTGCVRDEDNPNFYHLKFTTISGEEEVPGKTPLMIYISSDKSKVISMDNNVEIVSGVEKTSDGSDDGYAAFYTQKYEVPVGVTLADGTETQDVAVMIGQAVPDPLGADDFYFKWVGASGGKDAHGEIRRCPKAGYATKGLHSCLWQIYRKGLKVENVEMGSAKRFVVTGIDGVKNGGNQVFDINIYDLHGRCVGTLRDGLPSGVYIQGGKKFIKK